MRSTRVLTTSVVGLAALLAACADAPTMAPLAPMAPSAPAAAVTIGTPAQFGTVAPEQFRVCKTGSSASFSYTIDYVDGTPDESSTFALNDGQCASVAQKGGTGANVSVTETSAQTGFVLDRVDVTVANGTACASLNNVSATTIAGPTASGLISGTASSTIPCQGILATFYNVIPTGQIGNFVWVDTNNNGLQDSGEPGIPGVIVTLGGAATGTATTDANGLYLFSGLAKGSYTVTVGAGPAGFTASPANVGSNDAIDSDGLAAVPVTLPTNSTVDLTYDFGFAPPPPAGCTLTIGYWKTHAGFTGNNADVVTQYLPIWLGTAGGAASTQVTTATQAVSVLSMSGGASNGIVKLKAQLLGAKLNIAAGASVPAAVSATIAAADAFLAANSAASWTSLTNQTKAQVNTLMTALDNYNNGLVGPGHCGTTGGI